MIVESYANSLYEGHVCDRYWIPGGFFVMVGGSVLGPEDWKHLQDDYGITHVLNVETEHDDSGKVPQERLCQMRVPDDGTPFPADKVLGACLFVASAEDRAAHGAVDSPVKLYVHCQMGGSRSPAFAYALMRGVYELSAEEALAAVKNSCPKRADYGAHHYHQSYLSSVEAALAPVLGGR